MRSKEHIIPMWLLKLTGDPHRKIRIEFDPDTGADVIRPASTFHFPACRTCNQHYGEGLEAKARRIVLHLSREQRLSVSQCYDLLDWLDKIRVGLWLSYLTLHKDIMEPRFRIASRVGKKDRIAIVSVDPDDKFKGFNIGGCDNNVFRTTQAGIYLRINNIRVLSISTDLLVAPFVGLPYAKEFFRRQSDNMAVASMAAGDHKVKRNWSPFTMLGAVIIAQPIITLRTDAPEAANIYLNEHVLNFMKDFPHLPRIGPGTNTLPMQLISNTGATFRYCPDERKEIKFRTARGNSDAAFMHTLYAIFLQMVIEREPRRVVRSDGTKFGSVLGNYLYVQKLLQMIMRIKQLGIPNRDRTLTEDLISELQRFSRIREEMEAHAHGTLEPGTETPHVL